MHQCINGVNLHREPSYFNVPAEEIGRDSLSPERSISFSIHLASEKQAGQTQTH